MEVSRIDNIKAKISVLEDKLYEAKLKDNANFNNLGWGYGMRAYSRLKNMVSHADRVQERIDKQKAILKQLKELNNEENKN